ncbi:DUF3352 domain-containing protein [[Phormidium] sp. ETS-05]|uniref:DUF3352 domain-containing protein n=1 Tax=[Phormidium] sp. ETS-05 TaxID=222819 RepID=UPI0018EEDB3E|nr:DUF3352 domain-containing protein [[Phormidium] sp. ETS-05]
MSGKKSWVLVLAGLTVIMAGGAGAAVYFQSRFVKLTVRDSISQLPAHTIAAAYVSGDTEDWSQLQQFGEAANRDTIGLWLKQLEVQAVGDGQISVAQDILPWVGNVTVAMLPPQQPPSGVSTALAQQSNLVMLVGIKNKLRAWNFARKFQSRPGVKTEKIPYNGLTISKTGTDQSNATYTVVWSDYLAVAADRQSIEQVIDAVQSGTALDDNETAVKLLAKSEAIPQSLAHLYIFNPAATTTALQEFTGQAAPRNVQYFENAVASISLDGGGLRIKSSFEIPAGSLPPGANPQNLHSAFPMDTAALMVGNGISKFWSTVVAVSARDADVAAQLQTVRSAFKSYGNFDVDKEIFGWMDGDYAVGAILPEGGMSQPGMLMLFETSGQAAAIAAMKKLETFARSALPVELKVQESVSSIGNDRIPMTQWTLAGQGMILGGYGWIEKEKMLFAFTGQMPSLSWLGSADEKGLPEKSGDNRSLSASPNFQATVNSLTSPNQGYFYLDVARIFGQVGPMLRSSNQIPPVGLALLESINALAATTVIPDPETVQVEAIIALQRQK